MKNNGIFEPFHGLIEPIHEPIKIKWPSHEIDERLTDDYYKNIYQSDLIEEKQRVVEEMVLRDVLAKCLDMKVDSLTHKDFKRLSKMIYPESVKVPFAYMLAFDGNYIGKVFYNWDNFKFTCIFQP